MAEQSKAMDPHALTDYISFLRSSGFSEAAAKLELEFDPTPEAEKGKPSVGKTQRENALSVKVQERYDVAFQRAVNGGPQRVGHVPCRCNVDRRSICNS